MGWLLIAIVTFYAWETSHFQVFQALHESGPWLIRNAIELGGPASVIVVALIAVTRQLDTRAPLSALGRSYLWLCSAMLVISLLWPGYVTARSVAQGMVFAFAMERILEARRRLVPFLWGNAIVGIVCTALNMVPLLYFRGAVSLPTSYIDRAGGGSDDIKILSFGMFGRSEWVTYPVAGVWWNRLHGWSFEPIHWAYFVLWTAVCCLLLLSLTTSRQARRFLLASLALLVVHLYFVYSAAAFIVVALSAFTVLWHLVTSSVSRKLSMVTVYAGIVIGVGMIGPTALAVTPQVASLVPEEEILNKGENWESKLGFVRLGSTVLTRVVPDPAMANGAGHNLVFATYLAYGILGVLPLLLFEWRFVKRTLRTRQRHVQMAAILSLVAINHQVPTALFYPLGAIWIVTIGRVARLSAEPTAPAAIAPADHYRK